MRIPWKTETGQDYGAPVDAVIGDAMLLGFKREDFLKLAWACIDQAACGADRREASKAHEAIEAMLPEEPT